jgi:anti-sigma B factor antagonist
MRSAERLACPARRSVGTYVLPAYRSHLGVPASLMRTPGVRVRMGAGPGVGIGVGIAAIHHGCAAAVRRAPTGLVEPRCCRMASCHTTYPPFEVTVQCDDAVATVVVSGELDIATAQQLSAIVAEHGDARLLVLDLNAVTFIDSTGLRVLIEADRACAGTGSRLVVLAGDGPVRRLLDLCDLDGRLAVATDRPSPAARQQDSGRGTRL